jgi:hypothetical protein
LLIKFTYLSLEMAAIQSSSSSPSVATRDARDSRDAIESAAGVFRRNGLGEVVVDSATLSDLYAAMCTEISNLGAINEKTVLPQRKFNQSVLSGLSRLGFQTYLGGRLAELLSFSDELFCKHLITSTVGATRNPSVGRREDYQTEDAFKAALNENKPWCVLSWVREKTLDEIPFLELVRATRHLLGSWVFRVFGTRDLSETRTVTIKGKETKVVRCDPQRAEFRLGTRRIASERTCDFASALIEAYDYIVRFSATLVEFDFIKAAAQTCKQERDAFKREQYAARNGAVTRNGQTILSKSASPASSAPASPAPKAKPAPKPVYYTGPVASAPTVNKWSERKVAIDADLAAKQAKEEAERALKDAQVAEARAKAAAQAAAEAAEAATFTKAKGSPKAHREETAPVVSEPTQSSNGFAALAVDESEPDVQPLNQKGMRFEQPAKSKQVKSKCH